MIDQYLDEIEKIIKTFPTVHTHKILRMTLNTKQGSISDSVHFNSGNRLEFFEFKDLDEHDKVRYRYQFMNNEKELIFRYDNAPHHRLIKTFPHHKHLKNQIEECSEPDILQILLGIFQFDQTYNKKTITNSSEE